MLSASVSVETFPDAVTFPLYPLVELVPLILTRQRLLKKTAFVLEKCFW